MGRGAAAPTRTNAGSELCGSAVHPIVPACSSETTHSGDVDVLGFRGRMWLLPELVLVMLGETEPEDRGDAISVVLPWPRGRGRQQVEELLNVRFHRPAALREPVKPSEGVLSSVAVLKVTLQAGQKYPKRWCAAQEGGAEP